MSDQRNEHFVQKSFFGYTVLKSHFSSTLFAECARVFLRARLRLEGCVVI